MSRKPGSSSSGADRGAGAAIQAAMQAAVSAHKEGRVDAAIVGYRQVLRRAPDFPEAHNNLGVALKAAGRADQAAASYRKALRLRPGYAAAHANLASALTERGQTQEALKHAIEAVNLSPGHQGHCQVLAALLRGQRFSAASPPVRRALLACFLAENLEHQLIVPAALSLLKLDPTVRRALALAGQDAGGDLCAALGAGDLGPLFEDELLHAVLTRGLVPDAAFERLLTTLRRACLEAATAGEGSAPGLLHDNPALIAALARHCFHNGYAYAESPAETALLRSLSEQLPGLWSDAPRTIVLAMYRPLYTFDGAADLAKQATALPPALGALLRVQVTEPLAEREIARGIERLTPIGKDVSRAVRRQYEESPYPRWQATGVKAPRPLEQVVGELFPHVKYHLQHIAKSRILVAGCGTGKHALDVATRYRNAEVLAIDLSASSLAFAQRKLREAKVTNVRIAQADILALGGLDRHFDLIEAVGVLHHLADPAAGWRVLRELLAAGGLMKVGFYSTRARQAITAARELLARAGFETAPESIRAARHAIFALDPGHPARPVVGELDFYSLSGCRDLLFNVQERTYRLPEIAALLDDLELEFLGFEFADPAAKSAYAKRFPQDPTMTDLALWDAFEAANPETFRNMYQFWCRKPV
ncbi:MAG: methyltransferase domain-containing protein [Rhodospirillales bacterium]|nr:methyltransferase domain-containing protein [Rhodospirillales bacterium]